MAHFIDGQGDAMITVTQLKSYFYCQRIAYYETCLPRIRPRTYAMEAGQDAHEEERARARRRTLKAYELPVGERQFNVRIESSTINLRGIIDELVVTPEPKWFPVDYKLSETSSVSFEMQVVAYALLLEAVYQTQVTHGFIYLIGRRETLPVVIDASARQVVLDAIQQILKMRLSEVMPAPVTERTRCRACEFRRFCNDVV